MPFKEETRSRVYVALLIVFVFALMGEAALAQAPVKIVFLSYAMSNPYGEGFKALADEFNALQNEIVVELVDGGGDAPRKEKFMTMAAGGVTPDLTWHYDTQFFAAQDLIVPVEEYLNRGGIVDWLPGLTTWHVYEGTLYSAPFGINAQRIIIYSKPVFQDSGLGDPEEGWTWSSFLDSARKVLRVGSDGAPERYGFAGLPPWFVYPWMVTNSARLIDPESGEWYPDREATIEAIEFQRDLITTYGVVGGELGEFQNGRVGMYALAVQTSSLVAEQSSSGEIGATHFPVNTSRAIITSPYAFMLGNTGDTTRQRASWRFIEWMLEPEQQARFSAIGGLIPSRLSSVQDEGFHRFALGNRVYWQFVHEVSQYGYSYPFNNQFNDFTNSTIKWISRVIQGEISAAAAVDSMRTELNGGAN